MPKVTVMSLPTEMIEVKVPEAAGPKNGKKTDWQFLLVLWRSIKEFAGSLVRQNRLPINVVAFLVGRVVLLGEVAPFGLAYFAAIASLSRKKSMAVAVWAVAGVLSEGYYVQALIYVCSICLYYRFANKLTKFEQKVLAMPLFMFSAVFLSGLICSVWGEYTLYNLLLILYNAVLCMMLTYIFMSGVPLLLGPECDKKITEQTLACATVLLALAVAGVGTVTVFGYSVRNIIGGLVIMAVGLVGGVGMGATVGIVVGFVGGLTDGNAALSIGMYAIAGLLAGMFRSLGKVAVILGFSLGSVIIVLYLGNALELTPILVEAGIGSLLFAVIPMKKLTKIKAMVKGNDSFIWHKEQINKAVYKLEKITELFQEMANFKKPQATLEQLEKDDISKVLTTVGNQVCEKCERRDFCWGDHFYHSYQDTVTMLDKAYHDNLNSRSLPLYFQQNCLKTAELLQKVIEYAQQHREKLFWQKKCIASRQVLTEQLKEIGTVLAGTVEEMKKVPQADFLLAKTIKEKAAILKCPLTDVHIVGENPQMVIDAEKIPCNGTKECIHTILPLVAGLLQEKLVLHAQCGKEGRNCRLNMKVAKRLVIKSAVAACAKGKISGDTSAIVPLTGGKVALMLSDGMGSGEKAAGESTQAIRLLKNLLSVGFTVDLAVKTVNSMMIIRNPEEVFATMDMAVIDTYSGCTEFLKIGSAPSFIKRVGEVLTVKSSSLPIGILNQIEIEPITQYLAKDDMIVIVSDGIIEAKRQGQFEWLVNYLRCSTADNPRQVADQILAQALKYSEGRAKDDMTVMVAKLNESEFLE